MRITEATLKNQEQQIELRHLDYCNFLWIVNIFLRLYFSYLFYSYLIYVGGGFFIRKGNHYDRYQKFITPGDKP